MQDKVDYFAFMMNKDGIHSPPKTVKVILNLENPPNKKKLQSWLGNVNYYREFVSKMSTVVQTLTHLLTSNVEWARTEELCKHLPTG